MAVHYLLHEVQIMHNPYIFSLGLLSLIDKYCSYCLFKRKINNKCQNVNIYRFANVNTQKYQVFSCIEFRI